MRGNLKIMRKKKGNRYRIEYEFDLFVEDKAYATRQDILDCIREDAEVAISCAIADLIYKPDEIKKKAYRIVEL